MKHRSSQRKRAVIVVCDSLRADLIDERSAPTLSGLRQAAANFVCASSVFPSTTRVSAASLATGCLPAAHGLLGNTMVIDEGDGLVCLSVGKPDFVERLRRATGRTLLRPTLAQRLKQHGGSIIMSNVSPGAAYFQDPDGYGHVYHRAGSFGPGRVPLADGLDISVGAEGDANMTARFCAEVLVERAPAVAVLWLSEPDHTGHHAPLGSPQHRVAIASADRCVAQVLETIARIDPSGEEILLVVCSDHGMETIRRVVDLDGLLIKAGLKRARDFADVVIAPNGTSALIHFSSEARGLMPDVAHWLERQDFVGKVLAREALASVNLPLTGSLGIAVSLRCDRESNEYGVEGYSDVVSSPFGGEAGPGHGQHGGLGVHEQSPFLFLKGNELKKGVHEGAVSLIDIAPTVLQHLGMPFGAMDGRSLITSAVEPKKPSF